MSSAGQTLSFNVSSGELCFGGWQNVRYAAALPTACEPAEFVHGEFAEGGTVLVKQVRAFSIKAQTGYWDAYGIRPLHTTGAADNDATGWLVVARDVISTSDEANEALRHIMYVAGNPYEDDNFQMGKEQFTSPATFDQRVLAFGRYDWFSAAAPDDEESAEFTGLQVISYVVDKSAVSDGREDEGFREIQNANAGLQLVCDDQEYRFARILLNEHRNAAIAVLFFTSYTCFAKSALDQCARSAPAVPFVFRVPFSNPNEPIRFFGRERPSEEELKTDFELDIDLQTLVPDTVIEKSVSKLAFKLPFRDLVQIQELLGDVQIAFAKLVLGHCVENNVSVYTAVADERLTGELSTWFSQHIRSEWVSRELASVQAGFGDLATQIVRRQGAGPDEEDVEILARCGLLLLYEVMELGNNFARDMKSPDLPARAIQEAILMDSALVAVLKLSPKLWINVPQQQ
eukprot:TRINITY_DN5348_c0_g2_i2.p1 TRINITY_DN5348_c0_g2~~TRINITY_DN5348_c0_g2_i2.p1  ORF type:complete len:477 (-),score=107.26 TRINITY_DN5348_c0_g2_i2:183-1559(-)